MHDYFNKYRKSEAEITELKSRLSVCRDDILNQDATIEKLNSKLNTIETYVQNIAVDRNFEGGRGEIVDNLEDILDDRISSELAAYLEPNFCSNPWHLGRFSFERFEQCPTCKQVKTLADKMVRRVIGESSDCSS